MDIFELSKIIRERVESPDNSSILEALGEDAGLQDPDVALVLAYYLGVADTIQTQSHGVLSDKYIH